MFPIIISEEDKNTLQLFKGFVMGIIQGIDPPALQSLIDHNVRPPIFNIRLPDLMKEPIQRFIQEHKKEVVALLKFENAIIYATKYRRDLIPVITTIAGEKWFKSFLKLIKFVIMNINLEPKDLEEKLHLLIESKALKKPQLQPLYTVSTTDSTATSTPPKLIKPVESMPSEDDLEDFEEYY